MKNTLLLYALGLTISLNAQNNSQRQKRWIKNRADNICVQMNHESYVIESKTTYKLDSLENTHCSYLFYNNKYHHYCSTLQTEKMMDSLQDVGRCTRNGLIYLENINCVNYDCNVAGDFINYYDKDEKIIKREERNYHMINNKFLNKESYTYTYDDKNQVVGIVGITYIAKGKNYKDPKKTVAVTTLKRDFIVKTPQKIVVRTVTRSNFPEANGSLLIADIITHEYIGNKYTLTYADTNNVFRSRRIHYSNPDETISRTEEINLLEINGKMDTAKVVHEMSYNGKRELSVDKSISYKAGKLQETVVTDYVAKETRGFNSDGKLFYEMKNNKARRYDFTTNTWSEWKEPMYCPIN